MLRKFQIILETESSKEGLSNSEDIVCHFDLTVSTSLSTSLLERWSAFVHEMFSILFELEYDLKIVPIKHEA